MAAITYKFGVESDVTSLDAASAEMPVEGRGIGAAYDAADLGEDFTGDLASAVINGTHAGLQNMAWLRRVVEDALDGRGFSVEFHGREVKLVLNTPLPSIPAWNPPTQAGLRNFSLLSWTSKMGTPSFSLPAGSPAMGGTCQGANAGQTVVPPAALKKAAREVHRLIGHPVHLAQAICQHCYAEGGQYSTGQVQFAQVLRYAWTTQAVADGTFAHVMDWALKNADYHLEGKGFETIETVDLETGQPKKEKVRVAGERDGDKYFRLHDSGDLFSPEYIAAWKAVADANPDVTIWAPSRAWVVPQLRDAVNLINAPREGMPNNFVIRPSAYHVNESPPRDLGPGWAAGSCAFKDTKKPSQDARLPENAPYQWDCQAYQTGNDKVTCRDARAPGDDPRGTAKGCRACWKYGHNDEHGQEPGLIVNYTLH